MGRVAMTKIFISYRRADSEGYVGRLYDQLVQRFDKSEVFMDVDKIKAGEDFPSVLDKALSSCDALVAVIGPQWLNCRDQTGKRRLDDPQDFVRIEIATALKRNIKVIPALVQRASLPKSEELPPELRGLLRHNAIELSHDRFFFDVDRLSEAIGGSYGIVTVWGLINPTTPVEKYVLYAKSPGSSLLNNLEFEVLIDGKWVEPILPVKASTKIKVRAGLHTIHLVSRSKTMGTSIRGDETNKLQFKIKGGQNIAFYLEEQTSNSSFLSRNRYVLKPYHPVVEA